MTQRLFFSFLLAFSCTMVFSQNPESADTTRILEELTIKAYAYNRPASEVPASVAVVSGIELNRFSNTSILPAINTIPGVRMEERSPGSYRFSIRGSLLRSPFGVRNVKVYWNGLPFTDGGGNTYLNLLDFNSIGRMEVIKGPGGSLYGAGTGGVVLLRKPISEVDQLQLSAVVGSYGLQRYMAAWETHGAKTDLRVQYAHQDADGYREQTAMRRDAMQADVDFQIADDYKLSATVLYSDLFYETPGGLTQAQFDQDASQARPSGFTRGAVEQLAAVANKTGYLGISDDFQWNDHWNTQTGVYGSISSFDNPTIRNYEKRDERNFGIRTQTEYLMDKALKGKLTFGGEYQYFNSPIAVHGNSYGVIDTVQTDDILRSRLLMFFAQAELNLGKNYFLTVGASASFLRYRFTTLQPEPRIEQSRTFDAVVSPRLALLKKFDMISLYASLSQGFSPPSLAEVRPSAGTYNNDLNSERGLNYEIGLKGNLSSTTLQYEVTLYDFRLDETIVIQRTADGAEYFVNAGKTSQQGIEATVSWSIPLAPDRADLSLWASYTYNHYRFKDYQSDGNNYSGKRLTGVAPTIFLFGADVNLKNFYLNVTTNFTDAIPLNDANTAYASDYFLLGSRIGYRSDQDKKILYEIFAGVDNALDKRYSLGNDLNAIGGRYFNAAAPRNYYAGVKVTPVFRKKK